MVAYKESMYGFGYEYIVKTKLFNKILNINVHMLIRIYPYGYTYNKYIHIYIHV